MERKLVKQGRNALTVTLPSTWTHAKGLKPGDAVAVTERANELIISAGRRSPRSSSSVNAVGCDSSMMHHLTMAKYIEGYDTILIKHDCTRVANELGQYFIGMVVEQQTSTSITLRSIVSEPDDSFDVVLRRAAHMLVQQTKILVQIAQRKATFDDIKAQEKLLDKNILFCLRYLSKYERRDPSYRQFLVCSTIELAADQISRLARAIGRRIELAQLVAKHVAEYTEHLFGNDVKKMYSSLRAFRAAIEHKTFADGLAYTLAEIFYNYLGYISGTDIREQGSTLVSR